MKTKRKVWMIPACILGAVVFLSVGIFAFLHFADWGFSRDIVFSEQLRRLHTVHTAEQWLGTREGFANHERILQIYNSHEPLAQGYAVTTEDSWCAAFASAVAIQCNLTDIIPTECGCERQIGLWKEMGRWEENDNYLPQPGDYIYYAWDEGFDLADCTGWADHVGIVVGTAGPFIKVIEGNKDDMVAYRIILRGDYRIRGFGLPDYEAKIP
ncbi:MAG: CHAP domain-containing protein [Oscillospiraceae bacterium]|nr:CHAP domain-containing protein [Oscillospiraceae bacterium]